MSRPPSLAPPPLLLVVQDVVFFLLAGLAHGFGFWLAWLTVPLLENAALPVVLAWPAALFLYPFGVIVVVVVLDRLLPFVGEGSHPLGSGAFLLWGLRLVVGRVGRLPPATWLIRYSNVLRYLWLRGLGGDVAFTSQLSGDVNLLDHRPLVLGAGCVVGSETMITTHIVVKGELRVQRVSIGEGALVGARCILAPGASVGPGAVVQVGVRIGLGASVGARAVVKFDTVLDHGSTVGEGAIIEPLSHVPAGVVIPPNEHWGGVPARRVT